MQSRDSLSTFNASEIIVDMERSPASPSSSLPAQRPPRFGEAAQPLGTTEILKVSSRSRPSAVAGAIAGVMRVQQQVDVQSIGAGATNQAIKAVAIARVYLVADGIDLCCVPFFIEVPIDGEERTALRLLVQRRPT